MIKPNKDGKTNKNINIPIKEIKKKYIVECFGYGEIDIKLVEEKGEAVSK